MFLLQSFVQNIRGTMLVATCRHQFEAQGSGACLRFSTHFHDNLKGHVVKITPILLLVKSDVMIH